MARLWMITIAIGAVAATASCVTSSSVVCTDGRVCPAGSTCDAVLGRCVTDDQRIACAALGAGEPCQYRGVDGVCVDAICVPTSCGDGIVTGAEECDGTDLGALQTCGHLGYYDDTPLVCGADCRYDRAQCTAGLCGDDVRDEPEVCDGNDLSLTDCTELGYYEPGELTCNDACSFNTSQCQGYCGDAMLNGPEVCEAGLPILDTCLSYGYDRGYLACSRCLPDISSCRFIGWRTLPIGVSTIVRALHGTSRRDVFAAGSDGALLHYDGTRWTAMTPATFEHFTAVLALAPDHVVALGSLGTIQRFDGATWTEVMADASWRFNAIAQVGPSEAFAVGNLGVLRYDGATWSAFSAPGSVELTGVWGSAATDLYAIDTAGQLSHYNGIAWQPESLPFAVPAKAVWGTPTGGRYVAASDGVYQLVTGSWQKVSINFGAIKAGAVTDGNGGFCMAGNLGSVWCYDGQYWSGIGGSSYGFGDLGAVWASAADDVFVAGAGGIRHYEGSSWFTTSYPSAPLGFWGNDSVLYAASGDVLRQSGASTFATVLTTTNGSALFAIWGANENAVFAVGEGGAIQRFNGSTWSKLTNTDNRTLYGVWGSSATDVYAVGVTGALLHYNGAWSALASGTTANLRDVWGASATDVFAVGDAGTILHSDGGAFAPMTSGTTHDLRAVFGFAADDVYAVGAVGTLLHYDGAAWSAVPLGTGVTLTDVWGPSATDVFVVGQLGLMMHFDGARWTPVKRSSSTLLAVYGARNEIFLAMTGTSGQQLLRLAPW